MTLAQLLNTKSQLKKSILVQKMVGAEDIAAELEIELDKIERQIQEHN